MTALRSLVDGGVVVGEAGLAEDLVVLVVVRTLDPLPRREFLGKEGATVGLGVRRRLLSPILRLLSSIRLELSSIFE